MNHLDQDGRILDTIWDIYSVASGIYSAAKNTIKGEFKEALKDAAGVGLDVVSAVIPGVPAVGRVLRNGDNLVVVIAVGRAEQKHFITGQLQYLVMHSHNFFFAFFG